MTKISEATREERIAFLDQFEVYDFRYFIKPKIKQEFPKLSLWRTQMFVMERRGNIGCLLELFFHGGTNITLYVPDELFFGFIDGEIDVTHFYDELANDAIDDMKKLETLFK